MQKKFKHLSPGRLDVFIFKNCEKWCCGFSAHSFKTENSHEEFHQFIEFNIDLFKIQLKVFLEYVEKQANTSRTNNIILTMGGDFTYMDADVYYANLDRLIK